MVVPRIHTKGYTEKVLRRWVALDADAAIIHVQQAAVIAATSDRAIGPLDVTRFGRHGGRRAVGHVTCQTLGRGLRRLMSVCEDRVT